MTAKCYTQKIKYNESALDFYNSLPDLTNTVLLESADIVTKDSANSWVCVRSAVRISADKNNVVIKSLNNNGKKILNEISPLLDEFINNKSDDELNISFPEIDYTLEEQSRIQQPTIFNVLRIIKNHYSYLGDDLFLCGGMGYELIDVNEKLPPAKTGGNDFPAYLFYVADILADINHTEKSATIKNIAFDENEKDSSDDYINKIINTDVKPVVDLSLDETQTNLTPSINDSDFNNIVEQCIEYVKSGDVFQVVPSRIFTIDCPHPLQSYKTLKQINPSPYMFYMNDENFAVFGASPESALKYNANDNKVRLYPIAGTRPRGKNADGTINNDLDNRYELDLRLNNKETAEHIMLVDLARNDIARICKPSTRQVEKLMGIDKYSHVQHLVSEVVGDLKDELDCIHAYQICMNMGTLTGAPKIRATEIIREFEPTSRGSYGGAIGYITGSGNMDTCITIRSAFVKNETAYIGAGAGVVLDSIPQAEADETRMKAMSVIQAIAQTHNYKILGDK